jgi:hypothetical protein
MALELNGTTGVSLVQNGVITDANLPAGSVLQVVSTTKTDTFSTTSNTLVQITGLTTSITPASTSSKILIIANVQIGDQNNLDETGLILYRDSTQISLSSGGSSFNWTARGMGTDANPTKILSAVGINFLDAPSSASSITYSLYTRSNGSATIYINRSTNDSVRATSSLTLMEIAA